MPILFGCYSRKQVLNKDQVQRSLLDFSYNGTRSLHQYSDNKIILSSDKLWSEYSTIFENEEKTSVICYAGNIYGYKQWIPDLQKAGHVFKNFNNPAEFVLHAWEEYKESFVEKISGSFTIVIYDIANDKLILINDLFGIYPLFVYETPDVIVFCNEFEPILKFSGIKFSLDRNSILQYLTGGAPVNGKTFVSGLENLKPASIVEFCGNKRQIKNYSAYSLEINYSISAEDAASAIYNNIKNSVDNILDANPSSSCMLTAGLDSRFVTGCVPSEYYRRLKFISFLTPGVDPEKDRDIIIPKRIASKLSLDHEIVENHSWSDLWKVEFGMSLLTLWRERIDTKTLGGVYGGEFLNGGCFDSIPAFISRFENRNFLDRIMNHTLKNTIWKNIVHSNLINGAEDPFSAIINEYKSIPIENKKMFFTVNYLTRSFFSDIYGGINAKWQSPWMFPLKLESPFTDKYFLNTLMSLPLSILTDKDQKVYNLIYSDFLKNLTSIPTSSAFGKIENSCIDFFSGGLEPRDSRKLNNSKLIDQYLSDDITWDRKIFNRDTLLRQIDNPKIRSVFFDLETMLRYMELD